jgi:hypothetical protein
VGVLRELEAGAALALDGGADLLRPRGWVGDPRVGGERRAVTDVPAMAAVEVRDPVTFIVGGEGEDRTRDGSDLA